MPQSPIHARFSLGEVTRIKCYAPPKGNNKNGPWEIVQGVRVRLSPVSGEPFGSATPGGSLEMVIVNPGAVQIFNDAEIGQEFGAIFSLVEVAQLPVEEAQEAQPEE